MPGPRVGPSSLDSVGAICLLRAVFTLRASCITLLISSLFCNEAHSEGEELQIRRLQLQIGELQAERSQYRIAGPIAMTGAGAVIAVNSALYILLWGILSDVRPCLNFSPCSEEERSDFGTQTDMRIGVAVLGVGGAVLAVVGGITLRGRWGKWKELGGQIKSKRTELRFLESGMRFGALLGPQNLLGATVALTF